MTVPYTLTNAQLMHQQSPDTFWVPTDDAISAITAGDYAKACFNVPNEFPERMWVLVTEVQHDSSGSVVGFVGELANEPFVLADILHFGCKVQFEPKNVMDIISDR